MAEQQRRGENRRRRHVLANHNVEVIRGKRQQQLVSALAFFLGPDAHRDRRNEHQHDQREPIIQLIKCRQVLREERIGPKRCDRCQEHKDTKKHVPGWVTKVTNKVAFHDREGSLLGARQQSNNREQDQQKDQVIDQQTDECSGDVVVRHRCMEFEVGE